MSLNFGTEGKYPHKKHIQKYGDSDYSAEIDSENNEIIIDSSLDAIKFETPIKASETFTPTEDKEYTTKEYVDSKTVTFASQSEAEEGTDETKSMNPLRTLQSIVHQILNYSFSTLQTTTKTIVGAINELKNGKQDALVSGTNIKTINNTSILGSGDIAIDISTNASLAGDGTSGNPLKVNYEITTATDYNGATPQLVINDTENILQYITVSSGSTGDATITQTSYPTVNRNKNVIIYNSRGSDLKIVFPTANVTSGGITYTFFKYVDNLTIKDGYVGELNFIYHFTSSTTCQIIIVANTTASKSS